MWGERGRSHALSIWEPGLYLWEQVLGNWKFSHLGKNKTAKRYTNIGTYRLNQHSTVQEAGCVKMKKTKETRRTLSQSNISKKLRLTESPEIVGKNLEILCTCQYMSSYSCEWVTGNTICESKKKAHFWIPDWGWILFSSPRMIELPNRPSNKLSHLALSGPYIFYALMLLYINIYQSLEIGRQENSIYQLVIQVWDYQ